MNITGFSISADTLIGATVDHPTLGEATVVGVEFDLIHHEVVIIIDQPDNGRTGIVWNNFKDASIHLQSPAWLES